MNSKMGGLVIAVILTMTCPAQDGLAPQTIENLPPLETFILEPVKLNCVSIWVTADKVGPEINRACRPRFANMYSYALPVRIDHTKKEDCPESIARLLAEYTWSHHKENAPLTIFNGWKWEYAYSMSQYQTLTYDLPADGGSWEHCSEVILNSISGDICGKWLQITDAGQMSSTPKSGTSESHIEINTFSSIRTRHGYPKIRILQN